MIIITVIIFSNIHDNPFGTEFAKLQFCRTAQVKGGDKPVGAIDQVLVHKLSVFIISKNVLIQIIRCVYHSSGQTQADIFVELENMLIPGREQVIPVSAVDILGS